MPGLGQSSPTTCPSRAHGGLYLSTLSVPFLPFLMVHLTLGLVSVPPAFSRESLAKLS